MNFSTFMNRVNTVKHSTFTLNGLARILIALIVVCTVTVKMKPLRVVYQNLGLGNESYAKIADIEKLMASRHPHVLFVAETKVDQLTKDRFAMWHYQVETMTHQDERLWVAVQDTIKYKRRYDLELPHMPAIWLEFGFGQSKYLWAGVYREFTRLSPDKEEKISSRARDAQRLRWNDFLDKCVVAALEDKPMFVIGDMNINFNKWKQNGYTGRSWIWQPLVDDMYDKLINVHDFSQHVTDITRRSGKLESCLDLLLTNRPRHIGSVQLTNDTKSDHSTLTVTRKIADQSAAETMERRPWSKVDYNWLNWIIEKYWIPTLEWMRRIRDVNLLYNHFTAWMNVLLDERWPVKTFLMTPNYCPWMSPELHNLQKNRSCVLRRWKKFRNPRDLARFHVLRNECSALNVKLKSSFWKANLDEFQRDQDMWKMAKNFNNFKTSGKPKVIVKDGMRLDKPADVANGINDFFCDKIPNIQQDIPDTQTDPLDLTREWVNSKNIEGGCDLTVGIRCRGVKAAVKSLNNSNAEGPDHISTKCIKQLRKHCIPVYTRIVNLSLKQGTYPDGAKIVRTEALHKKGDKFEMKNYRPVAIATPLSKVIEKVVMTRMMSYLEHKKLLSDNQHGYRAHRSCTTAVLQLKEDIMKDLENGVDNCLIFTDMSSAFDTISHLTLINKLRIYGMNDRSIRWFESYLDGRAQYVTINGVKSRLRKIKWGVFQGSISGPFQFILLINDLVVLITKEGCWICIYADDSTIRIRLTGNIQNDQDKINDIIEKVMDYFNANKLKMNVEKTQLLVISRNNHAHYKDLKVEINGVTIKQVKQARLLGLYFTHDMKQDWFVHQMPNNLIAFCNRRLGTLRRIRPWIADNQFLLLAHGLVVSKLLFGLQFYWQTTEIVRDKVRLILNELVRLCNRVTLFDRLRTKKLYHDIGWLNMDYLADLHDQFLLISITRHYTPKNMASIMWGEKFKAMAQGPTTRSRAAGVISMTRDNQSIYKDRSECFMARSVRAYAKLPRTLTTKWYETDEEEKDAYKKYYFELQQFKFTGR